jgi:hypothetical protein
MEVRVRGKAVRSRVAFYKKILNRVHQSKMIE